jgi:alkanesulfonate monooxygenase SsuD/methylene tetrahydromethanopterin reductase-like flavin-dependent oxidoreductase (luciferase family)
VVLAKQLATLDQLAGGRLHLGIGVGGEYPDEWAACGSPFRRRGATTEATVGILRRLLDGRDAHQAGWPDGFAITPPAAHRVPFLFAGRQPAALQRAARLGDGWIGYLLSPTGFARARQELMAERHRLGLENRKFRTGILLPVRVEDSDCGARTRASEIWSDVTANGATFPEKVFAAGTPASVVEQIRAYVDAGCDELVLVMAEIAGGAVEQFRRLSGEVVPALHTLGTANDSRSRPETGEGVDSP